MIPSASGTITFPLKPANLQEGAAELLEPFVEAGIRDVVISAASRNTVMADLAGSEAEPWIDAVVGNAADKTSALHDTPGDLASTAMYIGDYAPGS